MGITLTLHRQVKTKYVLHAGSISKVNHSCNPNCGISVNETGARDFVAMRDINVNQEITFDYAMRNYGVNYFPKQCMCGSKGCRGKITGWKDLPDERKKIYKGLLLPTFSRWTPSPSKRGIDGIMLKAWFFHDVSTRLP